MQSSAMLQRMYVHCNFRTLNSRNYGYENLMVFGSEMIISKLLGMLRFIGHWIPLPPRIKGNMYIVQNSTYIQKDN